MFRQSYRRTAVAFVVAAIGIWAQGAWAQGPVNTASGFTVLSDDQIQLLEGGLTRAEAETLVSDYLELQAAQYAQLHGFPEALVELFDSEPEIRNIFISALEPSYDDIARAAQILNELNAIDPDRFKRHVHLAVALAVVHDQPALFHAQLNSFIYGVARSQFPSLVSHTDVYEYYTSPPRGHTFTFQPDDLPWPMLVYVVDNQISADERKWAQENAGAVAIPALYDGIDYDDAKRERNPTRLGSQPYTLPNIQTYGGVCGERAYFASRVGKTLCVPAMVACGDSRYGGSHAWVGYLVTSRRKAHLVFSGRYLVDHYYTGSVYNPQTSQTILDRHVAMMFDGVSLSYQNYQRSRILFRMADTIGRNGQAAESLALTEYALTSNPYLPEGWRMLMRHIEDGMLTKDEAIDWFGKMIRALEDHPDITFECIETFITCYAQDDFQNRQKMYQRAWKIYAGRPDLQFQLCLVLAQEMASADEKPKALEMLVRAVVQYSSEGSVVLPATNLAIQYAKDLSVERATYNELSKALSQFPQGRGSSVALEAYLDFKDAIESLNTN